MTQLLVIRACSAWVHRTCVIQYDYHSAQYNDYYVQQFTFTITTTTHCLGLNQDQEARYV